MRANQNFTRFPRERQIVGTEPALTGAMSSQSSLVRVDEKRSLLRFLSSRAQRGSVAVEYVILLTLVGVVVASGLTVLGPTAVKNYSSQRAGLYADSP